MRKSIFISLILLLAACAPKQQFQTLELTPESLTILHTNDIHGSFLPVTVKADERNLTNRELGGVLALNHYVKEIRQEQKNVLLLDAGDFMTGNPICDMDYQGAIGGPMIKFFNHIGYEGLCPGNHEFDISVENAQKLFSIADFPVFSANLFTDENKLLTAEPYQIYSKGNLVVGVIGVIVDDLPNYLNRPQKDQVFAKPSFAVIDSLAQILDPITDLIVVLSHSGLDVDKIVAENLGPEVDVIVGGHSHSQLEKAVKVNGKVIVQTGSKLRNLGRLDVTVVADTVYSYNYRLIPLWNEGIERDTLFFNEVNHYKKLIDEEYGKVIGELQTPWRRSGDSESNIGNYITDCIRNLTGVDFALINSGGIRQDLARGPIKKLDVKNILPFNNSITKFEVTGKEVMDLILRNSSKGLVDHSGILQVSGLKYELKILGDGAVSILNATMNGEKIIPERKYKGATVDFVISNADKYFGFVPTEVFDMMMPLTEVVMKAIEEQKVIDSKIEGRIVEVK
ncbi:bifunctional metallophosphatase/5'-nucleotidase [candidate division KSB1 bacterium]|nr:bifunctional metallophosphatase/5'-nucleotidase [candidate division KSB1 bacterium]